MHNIAVPWLFLITACNCTVVEAPVNGVATPYGRIITLGDIKNTPHSQAISMFAVGNIFATYHALKVALTISNTHTGHTYVLAKKDATRAAFRCPSKCGYNVFAKPVQEGSEMISIRKATNLHHAGCPNTVARKRAVTLAVLKDFPSHANSVDQDLKTLPTGDKARRLQHQYASTRGVKISYNQARALLRNGETSIPTTRTQPDPQLLDVFAGTVITSGNCSFVACCSWPNVVTFAVFGFCSD